ncbi:hypothetical protein BCR33DRAFT_713521 [Rhizoclosmatium globosum]|uniref:mRNA decay factor PAT1 domain-containing protein n=1 Tax=Rhizoclosmatium globosum TaxID=329046 RepID=A0A1Y2CSE2_9FUNG|nr:hypothetical protein BCR33DRAFT_713521 [Rhizoclosmatium globosum]|eukprot:ORY49921.1 hypothetical protein BCR33DRAFT_713521 [Rhizoclosmatium globosum]
MSFFGFDTSQPPRRGGPGRGSGRNNDDDDEEGGVGSRVDELLEEKFKFGVDLNGDNDGDEDADALAAAIDNDDDELNDETFGGGDGGAGTDFDFNAGASAAFASNDFFAQPLNLSQRAASPISPAKGSRGPSNQPAADVWASPFGKSPSGHSPRTQTPSSSTAPKMMSLEEIEAQMMAGRNQPQQSQLQQQSFPPYQQQPPHNQQHFPPHQPHQQFPPGFMPPPNPQQFPNQFGQRGGSAEKRIMSMMKQKQQQQQQQQFPPHQHMMGVPPHLQSFQNGPPGQFPPNFQQPQHMGRPNMPPNMQFHPQMGMPPPHMMGGPLPPGSPAHIHARPGFGPVPPGMLQGPNGPLLQNQIFNQQGPPQGLNGPQGPHGPQFGNFPSSPRNGPQGPMVGGGPQQQQGPSAGSPSDLQQDEMLRNAQEMAQQQHQMQQQQQQQRPGGRGDYGQMRYNNLQAQNNRKNVLLHTGFSNDENLQRGATGKGPGPFDGGWSHQSNRTPRWETIAKIQIAQLVSENPLRDDFYYQIYSQFRSGEGNVSTGGANWKQNISEMQAQMKKLIEGKKMKPKGTTLAMEGALGKISLTSVKNPRKLIQINQAAKEVHAVPTFSLYSCVLNIEMLKRRQPDPEDFGTEEDEQLPHPFPYFLSYSKGKRVFPRIIPYLTPDQMFSALTTLFSRAESLDVCNMPAGSQDEAIDLFISTVIPPLVSFISEVPLQVVNAFMRILLERHNMVWLAKSKAGLAFLALLLSRAEILKQGGGTQQGLRPPAADDLSLWTELYNFLFASLQGNFAAIFPPALADDTVVKHTTSIHLAVLGRYGCRRHECRPPRVLLTEVRDKIFETSRRGNSSEDPDDIRALANVNLFLNALGLGIDASQLAAM